MIWRRCFLRKTIDVVYTSTRFGEAPESFSARLVLLVGSGCLEVSMNMEIDEAAKLQRSLNQWIAERNVLEGQTQELTGRVNELARQLQEAKEQLDRKERLALLGEIVGGVAHDLRNPLGVIRNAVYYLQQVLLRNDQEVAGALLDISRALTCSERIVVELLDFARGHQPSPSIFLLSDAIESALDSVRLPSDVSVIRSDISVTRVNADFGQIERLLVNLIQNAGQSMPSGGEIKLLCKKVDGNAIIQVIDAGHGIEVNDLEKIFEPLFSRRAKGTGLGLALSRRYATQNGGSLNVESELGQGSTFTLTLPVA
jgi:signal transduction histidine kinase